MIDKKQPSSNMLSLRRRLSTAISSSLPALIKLKNERDPHKLFHLFKSNARNPLVVENRFAFEDTVSRLAGANRFDYIEHLLEQQKCLPQGRREGFMVRIIMLYGKAGMIKHAVQTFYNLHLFQCQRTVKSFNAALKVLTQTRDLNAILMFLNEVSLKFSIPTDVYSLNIVIKAFCDNGCIEWAYMVMMEMDKVGIKPDVVTYTTLISACYKEGRTEIASGLWNLMIRKGCYPNLTTFNIRIQYLVHIRRAWRANSLMRLMQAVKIKPDQVTFNLVIKGFFQAGYAEMAKRVYSSFHIQHYKPNSRIYQTMIHYLCKGRDFDLAYTLCKDSMSKNWFPSFESICVLLQGLSRNSNNGKANMIMTLVRKKVPPYSTNDIKTLENILSHTPKVD
ncbi:hypothetical protein ACHQM5_025787 [Ranunculus cassubicifolius]